MMLASLSVSATTKSAPLSCELLPQKIIRKGNNKTSGYLYHIYISLYIYIMIYIYIHIIIYIYILLSCKFHQRRLFVFGEKLEKTWFADQSFKEYPLGPGLGSWGFSRGTCPPRAAASLRVGLRLRSPAGIDRKRPIRRCGCGKMVEDTPSCGNLDFGRWWLTTRVWRYPIFRLQNARSKPASGSGFSLGNAGSGHAASGN